MGQEVVNPMNNRPIKFRIWIKNTKELVHWHEHPEWITDAIPFDSGDEWTDNCELMQFTGLLDINGKEIYEGDILQSEENQAAAGIGMGLYSPNEMMKLNNYVKRYHEVKFCNGSFAISPGRMDCLMGGRFLLSDARYHVEVVGNIFENPELLSWVSPFYKKN